MDTCAVSSVVSTILATGMSVILASVVALAAVDLGAADEDPPMFMVRMTQNDGELQILMAEHGLHYGHLEFTGDCLVTGVNGGDFFSAVEVRAGDRIQTDCEVGDHMIVAHATSNTILLTLLF